MYGFRCQALVSLGPLSTPIKDKADRFPVQAVLHPERGVRNFGVLVRIGDDFFLALANLFKRQSGVSHDLSRLDDSKRECTTAAPPLKRASTRTIAGGFLFKRGLGIVKRTSNGCSRQGANHDRRP